MDRREFVASSVAALSMGITGCVSDGSGEADTPASNADSTETATETGTATHTETPTETATATPDQSYSVTMEPVGTVEFDSVPETWATYTPGYADMGVALGQADGLQSVGVKSRFYPEFYDPLDGVSVDEESLTELWNDGIDEEVFFEMGADVHVIDPNWLSNNFDGWDDETVQQVSDQVAPFVGNTIFRRTDEWHDYRYYTMYEAFEKVAEVFQAEDRYEAFADLHDEYVGGEVADRLPPEDERPSVAQVFAYGNEPDQFSPIPFAGLGTNAKHLRDLGLHDALAANGIEGLSTTNRTQIDYETLLDIDPDVILAKGHEHQSPEEFQDTLVSYFEDHSVASQLTAVQDGRVYRSGPVYQGPIQNLFLVERLATSLYPDTFSGELFDRERVANIVTGAF